MKAIAHLDSLKAASQKQVDEYETLAQEIQADIDAGQEDLKGQLAQAQSDLAKAQAGVPAAIPEGSVIIASADLEVLKSQVHDMTVERDALRAAIQTEIEDRNQDTERLEKAIKPVEAAKPVEIPTPVEPVKPVEEAPVEAPKEEAAPVDPSVLAPEPPKAE